MANKIFKFYPSFILLCNLSQNYYKARYISSFSFILEVIEATLISIWAFAYCSIRTSIVFFFANKDPKKKKVTNF